MVSFIVRRMLHAVALVVGVITLLFFMLEAAPGSPVTALLGNYPATPQYIARMNALYGLDRPLPARYLSYIGNVFRLNLGYSFAEHQNVATLIAQRLGNTLLLTLTALVVASVFGVALGVWAATSKRRWIDQLVTLGATIGISVPVFWTGQVLALILAVKLHLLPSAGMYSPQAPSAGLGQSTDLIKHLIMPVIALALHQVGGIARIARASVKDTLTSAYVETAVSKRLSHRAVISRHVLRNSLLPVTVVIGYSVGYLLAGSILVETVFGWPGMGQLLYQSLADRDNAVVIGVLLFITVTVVVANLLTDVLHSVIDPRIDIRQRARA